MYLQLGSGLQNGKYEIIRTLGQGGFGITYEAEQVALRRKVAIKEFFMKEYCERDGATSHVTLGATAGSKELVARFRTKLSEQQMCGLGMVDLFNILLFMFSNKECEICSHFVEHY